MNPDPKHWYLLNVEEQRLLVLDDPGALLHLHLLGQVRVDDGRLALHAHPQMLLLNVHNHIFALKTREETQMRIKM